MRTRPWSPKEADDSLIVTNMKEVQFEHQVNIQEEYNIQLSKYLYVESFTDISLEEKNILRELWGFPPRFEPVPWTQICIEGEERCYIEVEEQGSSEEVKGGDWSYQDADGAYPCEHVEVGCWQECLTTS